MNYNNRKQENQGTLRNIVGFSMFGTILFLAFGVIPNVYHEELVESDVKHKITKFVEQQPNYADSLQNFDLKNGRQMAELEKIVRSSSENNIPAREHLDSKIDDRNRLVIKKEEIDQLIRNYADSVQNANNIHLGINYSRNGIVKSR